MVTNFWKSSSIIIDTREQLPYQFVGCPVQDSTLHTGDYSVTGLENWVGVERKSLGDYWGCLGKGRKRFEAELVRARDTIAHFLVVIEAPFCDLPEGYLYYDGREGRAKRSLIPGERAENSAHAWAIMYGVHFLWAGTREAGERGCLNWLKMGLRIKRHADREAGKYGHKDSAK